MSKKDLFSSLKNYMFSRLIAKSSNVIHVSGVDCKILQTLTSMTCFHQFTSTLYTFDVLLTSLYSHDMSDILKPLEGCDSGCTTWTHRLTTRMGDGKWDGVPHIEKHWRVAKRQGSGFWSHHSRVRILPLQPSHHLDVRPSHITNVSPFQALNISEDAKVTIRRTIRAQWWDPEGLDCGIGQAVGEGDRADLVKKC